MDEPRCPKCDSPMQAGMDTCPSCGEKVVPQFTPDPVEGEKGAFWCYRHKRVKTRLRCGRCGRAICPDCAIIGPAGPRCPECGKHKVPIRARAVAHEVKATLRGSRYGPLRYVWIFVLIALVLGAFRGCSIFSGSEGPAYEDRPYVETEGEGL